MKRAKAHPRSRSRARQSQPPRAGRTAADAQPNNTLNVNSRPPRWRIVLSVATVTLLPVAINTKLWLAVWRGGRPRAWDGTGHYGLAQIYNQAIFPDTFGWTHAYFGGMPFPNFYPPLFYWLIALLAHTRLLSFNAAFKLMIAVPVLLLPAAVWLIAWSVSDHNRTVALAAALAVIPLLIDYRFGQIGLSYHSTFLIGLYTQPLGFVLLAAWIAVYLHERATRWRFIAAALLLGLTALANFFNAITASLFVTAVLVQDLVKWRAVEPEKRKAARRVFVIHLAAPLVALCLTLFWLAPMASQYDYFVTRPQAVPLGEMIPAATWLWCALALAGTFCWQRQPSPAMRLFLAVCLTLAAGIVFAAVAPRWFPLQAPRFAATVNLLFAVPVGHLFVAAFRRLTHWTREAATRKTALLDRLRHSNLISRWTTAPIANVIAIALTFGVFTSIKKPSYKWSFYATEDSERIDGVLRFAVAHRDGRYVVEVPDFNYGAAALDSRALNSYLGAQGNEAVTVVFREASANALFCNPLVMAFSKYPDNFGISSVLANDLDFIEQPLARHIERARAMGIKYFVIVSPEIKSRLAREPQGKAVYDSEGGWTIFALQGKLPPRVSRLAYRPALVVSDFTFKLRRDNDLDFIRLAEEQFADGWFDVRLARSPEPKIDRLQQLDEFAALILISYACDDEDAALERLRSFAANRPLILVASEATLFRRIVACITEFRHAEIIARAAQSKGEWLTSDAPGTRYGASTIRGQWRTIRQILETGKMSVEAAAVDGQIDLAEIHLQCAASASVPVLIAITFHPNWRGEDQAPVYAVTPFFTLTFARAPVRLVYARSLLDQFTLWLSTIIFLLFAIFAVYSLFISKHRRAQLAGQSAPVRGSAT
ncbi:MAG: hypothetical protein V7641_4134 [Blastocatellia bacterium]